MSLTNLTQSPKWKRFMGYVYGWGASIVLIGALFKIQHYPGAGFFLILGMGTEAIIFFLSAFEPIHEEPDWSLVYPQLNGKEVGDTTTVSTGSGVSIEGLEQLQKLLEKISVQPDKLSNLSEGLQKLTQTTERLADLSDAAVATNGYVENMNKVASSANLLSDSYQKTASEIEMSGSIIKEDMEKIAANGSSINSSFESINENLSSLNAIYELQLKESKLKAEQNKKLDEVMESLEISLKNAESYKKETTQLSQNLMTLNKIYGNMLNAMSQNK